MSSPTIALSKDQKLSQTVRCAYPCINITISPTNQFLSETVIIIIIFRIIYSNSITDYSVANCH